MPYRYQLESWRLDLVEDLSKRTGMSCAKIVEYLLEQGRAPLDGDPDGLVRPVHEWHEELTSDEG